MPQRPLLGHGWETRLARKNKSTTSSTARRRLGFETLEERRMMAGEGVIALGTTAMSVDENAGTVSLPVVRTGGSQGAVAVQYTTVSGTATAGFDFVTTAGSLQFADGQTTASIVVPIVNDSEEEGAEAFNVAVDQVSGGATLGIPRTATVTIVDDDVAPTIGDGNGLVGLYYSDPNLTNSVFARTDTTVDFDWQGGTPDPRIPSDNFSVRWSGLIEPLYSETYTFYTTGDDGVRLWVNDQLLIDQWHDGAATTYAGALGLQAGQQYDIVMEYYEHGSLAVAKLEWGSASQTREIIPQSQLSSDTTAVINGTFAGETLISGLVQPTAMDFGSDGRIFVAEQQGVVRVYHNGTLLAQPFIDISAEVNNIQDRGLIGLALHPDFENTPYVYLSYTYDPPETAGQSGKAGPDGGGNRVGRVIRVTADAAHNFDRALPGSEVVILGTNSTWENISFPNEDSSERIDLPPSCGPGGTMDDCLCADSLTHTVGALQFGLDGMLYVANGDGTSFGRVDPRSDRVQDVDSLSGKMLRIDPITGAGLSDNPFYNGDPNSNTSKVLNYGLRNPFRFAFHPTSGIPYIGDVGWTTWEEINMGVGANFGWPYYEGGDGQTLQTGGYSDLPEAQQFYASNPDVTAPLWSRSHLNGGVAVVVGDFYTGDQYPTAVRNALFFTDVGDGVIRALRLNPDGSAHQELTLTSGLGVIVEMSMGPDGLMYYVDIYGSVGRLLFDGEIDEGSTDEMALVRNGNVVDVYGTDGDNQFIVSAASASSLQTINMDGVDYDLGSGITELNIHGEAGADSITVTGSPGDDLAELRPDLFTLTTPDATITGDSLEDVNILGGGGVADQASFYDSVGDDTFTGKEAFSKLTGDGYSNRVEDYDAIDAYATAGGNDTANFYDGVANDRYVARADLNYAYMAIGSLLNHASGFETNNAYATAGGNDTANFYDSADDDRYVGRVDLNYAYMTDGTQLNSAENFERTNAFATAGGNDTANFYDGASNDKYVGRVDLNYAYVKGGARMHYAENFERTNAFATAGGNDTANFYDGTSNDKYVGRIDLNYAYVKGGARMHYAENFERTNAFATAGGNDKAKFYDGGADDRYAARIDLRYAYMTGSARLNYAENFERTNAYATAGGNDTANFYDGDGNDHYVADANLGFAYMTGGALANYTEGFERTNAYATAGGNDTAVFHDSSANDIFDVRASIFEAYMLGGGQVNYSVGFENAEAHSTAGGFDEAHFEDSSDNDVAFASGDLATMSGPGYDYSADDFDLVRLSSLLGGTDDLTVEAVDYVLETVGDWNA